MKQDTLTKHLETLTERLRVIRVIERETLGEIRKIRQKLSTKKQ